MAKTNKFERDLASAMVNFSIDKRRAELDLEETLLMQERAILFRILVSKPWTMNRIAVSDEKMLYSVSDWMKNVRYPEVDTPEAAVWIAFDQEKKLSETKHSAFKKEGSNNG